MQKSYRPIYARINQADRIKYYSDFKRMWNLACSDKKRYAVLQSRNLKLDESLNCKLDPVGKEYFKTWIVGGIAKDFVYRRSINIG